MLVYSLLLVFIEHFLNIPEVIIITIIIKLLFFILGSAGLSLAVLVSSLEGMSDEYFNVREKLRQLEGKLEGLKNMTSEEMKQVRH